jgi:hypothetical protein
MHRPQENGALDHHLTERVSIAQLPLRQRFHRIEAFVIPRAHQPDFTVGTAANQFEKIEIIDRYFVPLGAAAVPPFGFVLS